VEGQTLIFRRKKKKKKIDVDDASEVQRLQAPHKEKEEAETNQIT
jgi:hypothetical protein